MTKRGIILYYIVRLAEKDNLNDTECDVLKDKLTNMTIVEIKEYIKENPISNKDMIKKRIKDAKEEFAGEMADFCSMCSDGMPDNFNDQVIKVLDGYETKVSDLKKGIIPDSEKKRMEEEKAEKDRNDKIIHMFWSGDSIKAISRTVGIKMSEIECLVRGQIKENTK